MSKSNNTLSHKQRRGENIIKHPQESYVEVSVRSIKKIRDSANKKEKCGIQVLREVMHATWPACLGAIFGYIPSINTMWLTKTIESSLFFYVIVLVVGIFSFFLWIFLERDNNVAKKELLNLISAELSEDTVPINKGMEVCMNAFVNEIEIE